MVGGGPLRGSRVGAGRPGDDERGDFAPRTRISFYCANGHATRRSFAADAEAPQIWDCPQCGSPAGRDESTPPPKDRHEPYKTHLDYVKERRTDSDGEALLAQALARIADRRSARD